MADSSKIEWTDATWNPVTGCTKVSPGCDHCYAETFAERFRGVAGHHFERGFDVVLRPERLDQPLRWKRGRRIFVNSMSDLFHDQVPNEFIARVFAVMALADQHTFQVLTKRHGRMRSWLSAPYAEGRVRDAAHLIAAGEDPDIPASLAADGPAITWPLPNVWVGVSVEDQQRADLRIPALVETPAAVRFLSMEPLLGPVCLDYFHSADGHYPGTDTPCEAWPAVDWVIVGGESGRGARPMSPTWVRDLRRQCTRAGIPFHFKQWGSGSIWADRQGDRWTLGADGLLHTPETQPFPREHVEKKWGPLRALSKKDAGRELDGRTWDEFPTEVTA